MLCEQCGPVDAAHTSARISSDTAACFAHRQRLALISCQKLCTSMIELCACSCGTLRARSRDLQRVSLLSPFCLLPLPLHVCVLHSLWLCHAACTCVLLLRMHPSLPAYSATPCRPSRTCAIFFFPTPSYLCPNLTKYIIAPFQTPPFSASSLLPLLLRHHVAALENRSDSEVSYRAISEIRL